MTAHTTAAQPRGVSVALIRNWPLTAISWLLLPVLVGLGFWQLQRAEEKAQLNAAIDERLAAQPRSLTNSAAAPTELQTYTPVRLLGHYTDEIHYLDNRTRDGRVGYEILQVFVSDKQRWLVNRGWVEAGASRDALPEISWPRAAKVITGFLYPAEQAQPNTIDGPRVQRLDRGLTERLQLAQPEWSIRLSADSDTALRTDWQLINSPPARHTAYAVQWFAMAAALLLLWLFTATRLPQKLKRSR